MWLHVRILWIVILIYGYTCGSMCGYTSAAEWLHAEYELLNKCMVMCMVTWWLDVGDMFAW